MRGLVAVVLMLLIAAALRAEEPHIEFARALRAQGMPDFAADYLQRLGPRAPASIRDILPLEIAAARLDRAVHEGNDARRERQFAEARAAYEAFLRTRPNHPSAVEASLDLARLISLQGKHCLARARRSEDAARCNTWLAQARALFAGAAAQLADARRRIDARLQQIDAPANESQRAKRSALTAASLDAELEYGVTLFHSALAMPDRSVDEIQARAGAIAKARAALERLAKKNPDHPSSWQARVWLGRCALELDSKTDARKIFEAVAAETNPAAASAARSAALLLLKSATDEPAPNRTEQARSVMAGLEAWLQKSGPADSPVDVQTARYLLASLLEEQAQSGISRDRAGNIQPLSPAIRTQLQRAARLWKEVADSGSELADRARVRRAGVLAVLVAERATGDLTRLVNFEECYLAAQVELHELSQNPGSPAEAARRQSRVIAALRRALALVDRRDDPRDVADARALLAYAYLASGDPYSAAVFGESVGRGQLADDRSADATAYALQGYAGIIALARQRGAGDDELLSDRRRLRSLAEFMEATWPDEPATDLARHQLARFLIDERQLADAADLVRRLAPSYPGLAQARYELGVAAQRAQGPDSNLAAEQKRRLLRQAIAELERTPDPSPAAGDVAALAACMALCQLGNLYLLDDAPDDASIRKAVQLSQRLIDSVPRLNLDEATRPQVQAEVQRLRLTSAHNLAYRQVQRGQLAAAEATLAPALQFVTSAAERPAAAEPDAQRDVWQQIVLLSLRLAIQQGQPDAALRRLAQLRRVAGPGADVNNGLLRLVMDLKREAEALRKQSRGDDRDRLERGLVVFLDELARPTHLPDDVRVFLAQAYSGLDRHERAAQILKSLAPPAAGAPEDAVQRYRAIQLLAAREHRLARQFDEARALLQEMLGSWGKTDLGVRQEKVCLLEDAGNYAAAVQECREIKRSLLAARNEFERAVRDEALAEAAERTATDESARDRAIQDRAAAQIRRDGARALRDRYWEFDALDTRIVLRSCQKVPDAAARRQKLAVLAESIVRLEGAFPHVVEREFRDRYLELFTIEPELRTLYREAGGRRLLAEDGGAPDGSR